VGASLRTRGMDVEGSQEQSLPRVWSRRWHVRCPLRRAGFAMSTARAAGKI